eukprot:gene4260-8441_t
MPKKGGAFEKEEEPVRAIVFADTFDSAFFPLTQTVPRCLLPLCGVKILDYTLQMLVESGMKEILVLCRAHEDKINKHISNSPCWESNVRCKVTTKSVAHCRTVGDCIRDVQESALINGDFVLVYGDVVSNLNLSSFIEKHKARYIEDKANIMTMLFKVTEPDHPLRSAENDFAVALGDTDRMDDSFRLLSYVKKHEGESSKSFDFPKEIFAESTTVQLRNNFLDAQIYICSQEVLILFADEFDIEDMFGSIRFIHTDEIRCERIYCHIIEDEYAARVSDINAYDIISKDIICRWTHPLVPDVFRPHGSTCGLKRYNIYLEDNVVLTRGCAIEGNTMISSGTTIGHDGGAITSISDSVVGPNCVIGPGCSLRNCYIFGNVKIAAGCTLQYCIIGENCRVKKNVTLGERTVVGPDVALGPSVSIPAGTLISSEPPKFDDDFSGSEDSDENVEGVVADADLGSKSVGYMLDLTSEDDGTKYGWRAEEEPVQELEDSGSESEPETSDDEQRPASDPFEKFAEEVVEVIEARVVVSLDLGKPVLSDELCLEIRGSRAAYNMSMSEVVQGISVSICKAVCQADDSAEATAKQISAKLKRVFLSCIPVFSQYVKTANDRNDFVWAIHDACFSQEKSKAGFTSVLHALFNDDDELISQEAVEEWAAASDADPGLRKQAQPFLDWLAESDDESDD